MTAPALPRGWQNWPRAQLEELLAGLETIANERASGKGPWLCDIPDCDGRPHKGRSNPHSRADQRPPADPDWDFWALFAGRGFGKATGLSTLIPVQYDPGMIPHTTSLPVPGAGFKPMGEIQVGDRVFDESGRPCNVTAVYDRMAAGYRVTFSDGTFIDACDEHQWVTWTHAERKAYLRSEREPDRTRFPAEWPAWRARRVNRWGAESYGAGPQIRTTQQIADTLTYGKRGDRNHCIPLAGALRIPETDLPLDPWLLGYWLGNGSVGGSEITGHLADGEGIERGVRDAGFEPTRYAGQPGGAVRFGIPGGFRTVLRALGVLDDKHVPEAYLWASEGQREALLAGLLDSDGYCNPENGHIEFCSTTRTLADAVVHLARTLGQKPVVKESRATLYGVDHGPKWRVTWRPTRNPFRLPRKATHVKPDGAQGLRNHHRMIMSVEPIEPQMMRCITVDGPHSMYLAGEGLIPTHNTRTGAEWVIGEAKKHARGALVGPTAADVRDIMVEGESGILACARSGFRPEYQPSKRRLVYPNGAMQFCYSADEPERLRGPQHHYAWADELAAWRYIQMAWDMLMMGMRLGEHPRICATTTPRPLPLIKWLAKHDRCRVVSGSTYANLHNLAPTFARTVLDRYAGTTLGRQELDAEILDDLPGALVARKNILYVDTAPELDLVVVAVDPAGTGTGDEAGIVVVGRGRADGHAYVLADLSARMSARQTGLTAWKALYEYGAQHLVYEDNFGKQWLRDGLVDAYADHHKLDAEQRAAMKDEAGAEAQERAALHHNADLAEDEEPVKVVPNPFRMLRKVTAQHGKVLRAQPVAMRYEQHKVHHVGQLTELEDQLVTWDPHEDKHDSPDRIDALVHGVTFLLRRERAGGTIALPHQMGLGRATGGAHPFRTLLTRTP